MLRDARGAPFGLPVPRWMLELGAVFMRTETELILKSRRRESESLTAACLRFFPAGTRMACGCMIAAGWRACQR